MRNTKMHVRAAALTVSALALATSAIFAAPRANAAAGQSDAEIPAEMRFALQRDLGMMPGQIPQYLRAEKRMPDTERKARSAFGKHYAGSWLERNRHGEYEPVVAVAGAQNAGKVGTLGVQVRVVAHSLAQLQATQARLDGVVGTLRASGKGRKLDPSIHSWYVDPISNRVVVTTDRGARGAALDFVSASGADTKTVRFVEADSRPRPAQQANFDVRGGDRYNLPGGWCSIGFAVTLGTENGFVTAGHCGIDNTAVTNNAGQSLGYIFDSVFPGSDFAVVHNTNPLGIPRPWVNAYAFGGNLNIVGGNPAALNAVVCRSGARTGAHCGTLLATGVTVNYGASGLVFNLASSTTCVGGGDSGGSFVTPEGQAQGVTSGGSFRSGTNDNCATPLPVGSASSFYQPLQAILANYPGLTLMVAP